MAPWDQGDLRYATGLDGMYWQISIVRVRFSCLIRASLFRTIVVRPLGIDIPPRVQPEPTSQPTHQMDHGLRKDRARYGRRCVGRETGLQGAETARLVRPA